MFAPNVLDRPTWLVLLGAASTIRRDNITDRATSSLSDSQPAVSPQFLQCGPCNSPITPPTASAQAHPECSVLHDRLPGERPAVFRALDSHRSSVQATPIQYSNRLAATRRVSCISPFKIKPIATRLIDNPASLSPSPARQAHSPF
jgi:hypothetical protein